MKKKLRLLCSFVCFITIISMVLTGCEFSFGGPQEDTTKNEAPVNTNKEEDTPKETSPKDETTEEETTEEETTEEVTTDDVFATEADTDEATTSEVDSDETTSEEITTEKNPGGEVTTDKRPDEEVTTNKKPDVEEMPDDTTPAEHFEYFPLPDGTYGISGGNTKYLEKIVLPATYNGKAITKILPEAFATFTSLKSITLSKNIVEIGDNAFSGCVALESVTVADGVKSIGEKAFYNCLALKSVTLPDGITSVGYGAFHKCKSLNEIKYKGTVLSASKLFSGLCVNTSTLATITCSDGSYTMKSTSKQAVYNTTTATMPSNWNEITYVDNIDTQIMSYIGSSFFEYDYKFENDQKFNADGSINKAGIVPGAYTTNYSAATKLEDVTSKVDAKWGYTDAQKKEGGYAWKITLRDDLKWDDGTPIKASDFVYSMKQVLDPDFMNYRANTYYDTLMIKNAKTYFNKNQEGTYEPLGSQGYASVADAVAAGETLYVNVWYMWGAEGYTDAEGNECPEYVAITDETVYSADGAGYDEVSGALLYETYGSYLEPGTGYDACIYVENTNRDIKWEDVGIYKVEGENAIVICLDKSYEFLTDDGELSVWAPYYMSSLPLVKESLYESCKIAPAYGDTLWTTNYNTSLSTTASWGPYKLVEFEADSHYRLEKNEYWFGWNMDQYNNQYNVTAINCTKEFYWSDQTTGFLNGTYDDCGINNENFEDFGNSKYVYYTSTDTGTFGMQLYSNLDVLKDSENNNGILAIREFRQAFNLALNRSDIVEKIWPGTAVPCFGLLNSAYYYDIENAPKLEDGGQYRNNKFAKEGILRAYGFTEKDGKWSNGTLNDLALDEAYEALTGYNPTLAKEKMKEAIEILLADTEKYGYDSNRNITIVYGSSADASNHRYRAQYLQDILDELTMGTALEDKIDVVFENVGSMWAEAFRNGDTQIGFGYGFSGNAFNPFDIVGAFVNPDDDLNYHTYWDTSAINMTLTMPVIEGESYEGQGLTFTMSVLNWYYCLNGLAASNNQPNIYNWDANHAPIEARITILSALEEFTIKESRSIMLIAGGGGTLLGAKFSYISDVEHTFMGFGGIRYMEVNYTDEEWAEFVQANDGNLSNEYKKVE